MAIKTPIDLGAKPKVRNREDLENAMINLRSVTSHVERHRAHRNAKVAELDADLAGKLVVLVGESEMPAEVYAKSLTEAIVGFAQKSPEALGGRTLALASGTVALRKNPDKIDSVEGKSIDDIVTEKMDLIGDAVSNLLKKTGLASFFSFVLKPDLSGIKTLYGKKMLTDEDLSKNGFRLVTGEDRVDVKVGD